MKKLAKRLKCLICYILIISMVLPSLEPIGTVNAATQSIGLNMKKATILVGEDIKLELEGDTIQTVTSKNKKIATVRKDGTVTGKKAGKTTVTVTGSKGKQYKCTVTVKIGLSAKKAYITQGSSVTIKLGGTTVKSVSSKKKKIAEVSKKTKNTVVIKAKSKGTTKIKVKGKNKKTYTCTVTVEKPVLDQTQVVLAKGDKTTLHLNSTKQEATWSSSAESIVRVSDSGALTAVAAGEAVISAVDQSKKVYTCRVQVEAPKMAASELHMDVDQTLNLALAGNTQKVSWKSANSGIVSVDGNGKVTARSSGTVVVTATVESGASFWCTITVADKPKKYETDDQNAAGGNSDGKADSSETSDGKSQKDSGEEPGGGDRKNNGSDSRQETATTQETDNTGEKTDNGDVSGEGDRKNNGSDSRQETATTQETDNTGEKTDNGDVSGEGDRKNNGSDSRQETATTQEADNTGEKTDNGAAIGEGDHKNNGSDSKQETPTTQETDNPGTKTDNGEEIGTGDPEQASDDTPEVTDDEVYVNFMDMEGGSNLKPVSVPRGTTVGSLPTPTYSDNRTFVGWYYDEEYTKPANAEDTIEAATTLYAKSMEMAIETPEEVQTVTAVNDVEKDFKIVIRSTDASLTADQVFQSLEVTNVIHSGSADYQLKENNIAVTGGNGVYTLTGKHILIEDTVDGFEAGGSYVIKLPELVEDADYLSFDGQPKSVREFDVNIAQKEVNNMALNNDVVSIAVSDLDGLFDENGKKQDYIDGSFYTVDAQGNTAESEEINGYFVWKEAKAEELQPGTTIALYSGMDPVEAMNNPEKFDEGENHIAYLFINKIDGNKFYFGNADMADIIKMPEILPIPADADLNLDDLSNTLEIMTSELDWSDDKYSDVKLDSQTKLEEGDFIVLYKGEYGTSDMEQVGDYLEVTEVAAGGTTLNPVGDECEYVRIITKKASLESIAESGDTNYSRPIDVMNSLTSEQKEEIKEQAVEDAKASGFLEEAGVYLAKTAMATEGFTSLDGVEEIEGLEDYDFVVKDTDGVIIGSSNDLYDKYKDYSDKYKEMMETYKQFSLDDDDDDDGAVDVELENLDVDLIEAQHLPDGIGIHMNVQFKVEVTVPKFEGGGDDDKKDGEDGDKKDDDKKDDDKKDDDKKDDDKKEDEEPEEENKLTIEIEADFVQEIQLSMGFNAKIEWKEILCIPYPADVIFSPSFTTGTYTGISVEATAMTVGQDDGMGDSILEDHNTVINDISEELKNLLEEDAVEEDEEAEEISNWLAVKYKQMLEQEHDAITLVELSLFETKYELFPGIVQFGLEVKFVVTVDVVVTIGMEFSNIQSKKTIYNIHVLKGKCDSETVELIPAELDFKFYVMGSLELKVGFEIELSLELTASQSTVLYTRR